MKRTKTMKLAKGKMALVAAVAMFSAVAMMTSTAQARGPGDHGRGSGPIIYVTGQDLFFDSIVLTDLPLRGRFQLLETGGPTGLQTEFGPGDVGYVGGRWWMDANGDGEMDEGDAFFMCPLLGPGRINP
jgi:hypothetical protein